MTDRRYEFFISSTYEDLKEERRFLQEVIIRQGHIPVGMELFDAGFASQWDVISKAIDEADYYVVIIAGRYGSISEDGLSYTEKEFRYASERRKPVIVFMLRDRRLDDWNRGDTPDDPRFAEKQEKLRAFRESVAGRGIVNYWDGTEDLKAVISDKLFSWVQRHPRAGWVRASKYEEVGFKRDVYTYLFNQLNPFDDVRITEQFITTLDRPLTTIDNVLLALRYLIKDFVAKRVRHDIRVYFAFRLQKPVEMCTEAADDAPSARMPAYYCLGISSERQKDSTPDNPWDESLVENPWMEGYLIGEDSNTHNVYQSKKILPFGDARQSRAGRGANQVVPDEGSVLGTPVLYGKSRDPDRQYSIGVLGLSSPNVRELESDVYRALAEELQSLFSALFYAYGQTVERRLMERSEPVPPDQDMAQRVREEIATHYELWFAGNYPNKCR